VESLIAISKEGHKKTATTRSWRACANMTHRHMCKYDAQACASTHPSFQHQQSFATPLTQTLDHIQVAFLARNVKARPAILHSKPY
jgi:hypothetical protein